MTIERAFGKFKSQWKLFASTLPRYFSDELTLFLQAAFVMHNLTITIDQPDEEVFPDDPHLSKEIHADLSSVTLRQEIASACGENQQERRSQVHAQTIRNRIKDYLELFIK